MISDCYNVLLCCSTFMIVVYTIQLLLMYVHVIHAVYVSLQVAVTKDDYTARHFGNEPRDAEIRSYTFKSKYIKCLHELYIIVLNRTHQHIVNYHVPQDFHCKKLSLSYSKCLIYYKTLVLYQVGDTFVTYVQHFNNFYMKFCG